MNSSLPIFAGRLIISNPSPTPDEFAVIFQLLPAAYALLERDFRVVAASDAYLAQTMKARDEIIGRSLFDVLPDNPADPKADGVRSLRGSLLRVLATGKPDRMPVQRYDIRRSAGQGGTFEERYWTPCNVAVPGPDGSVRYLVHSIEDVTQFVQFQREMARENALLEDELRDRSRRMEAERFLSAEAMAAHQRLAESERRYRFLADATPQLIWTAEPGGALDYVNERWTTATGLAPSALMGRGWVAALPAEERDRIVAAWAGAIAAGTEFRLEHRLRHADGRWRWMLTAGTPYRDSQGVLRKWYGTTTDIHDRVIAEEEARRTQRLQAVGKLAGGMAHEVNNMMTAVLGFGEMVLNALGPHHPQRRDLMEIVNAGDRAAKVSHQLLAFSRQQVLKPMVLDLGEVVSGLTPALERLAGADRRLEVVARVPRLRAVADRTQIEQILVNLVANARDATGIDGMITIELDAVDEAPTAEPSGEPVGGPQALLTVSDNGIGMDENTLGRVFEPFFTTKPMGQGTGLGLSTVYGIVRQSGGRITIESAVGQGSQVRICFPLAEVEPAPDLPSAPTPRGNGETILVVEDESMVRSLARRILEHCGYAVYQAPNGSAALQFLSIHWEAVDLVLTDLVMPRMSGHELTAAIARRYSSLPVIQMSGYSGDEMRKQGLLDPSRPFLQKPFNADALAVAVRRSLDQIAAR